MTVYKETLTIERNITCRICGSTNVSFEDRIYFTDRIRGYYG